MVASPATTSLYVTRWRPLLGAVVSAGVLVFDVLFYFVLPTPSVTANAWKYQEPGKSIMFIVILLLSAAFVAIGLYWTVTPRPMLLLSESGLIYRPYPLLFPMRTLQWDDVEHLRASTAQMQTGTGLVRFTILTLWYTLKPNNSASAPSPHIGQLYHININVSFLSLRDDELITFLRVYHDVEWP